jgi:predicted ester cyclase
MTPEDIKTFFYSIYDEKRVWGTPEMLDEFYAYIAPEFIFHRPPFPDVAGIEANRESDEAMKIAFSENKVSIEELVVEGDTAVLRYTWEGIHTGISPTLGIPPTGMHVKSMGCSVYHWRDGKIVEMWDYLDLLGLLQQIGVIPAMG